MGDEELLYHAYLALGVAIATAILFVLMKRRERQTRKGS